MTGRCAPLIHHNGLRITTICKFPVLVLCVVGPQGACTRNERIEGGVSSPKQKGRRPRRGRKQGAKDGRTPSHFAILLLVALAPAARAATVHEDAHADRLADLKSGDEAALRSHDADDLVAGDHRVLARVPLVLDLRREGEGGSVPGEGGETEERARRLAQESVVIVPEEVVAQSGALENRAPGGDLHDG